MDTLQRDCEVPSLFRTPMREITVSLRERSKPPLRQHGTSRALHATKDKGTSGSCRRSILSRRFVSIVEVGSRMLLRVYRKKGIDLACIVVMVISVHKGQGQHSNEDDDVSRVSEFAQPSNRRLDESGIVQSTLSALSTSQEGSPKNAGSSFQSFSREAQCDFFALS